jgi:F-type H+-transporting ATPase subunit epsilon
MKTLTLKIITPEKVVFNEDVEQVTLPTENGEITVLPGHIPLVTILSKGEVLAKQNSIDIPLAAVGGFVKVSDNTVSIMADFAEHINSLTDEAIEEARQKAVELKQKFENKEIVDIEHFETELERSLTRVRLGEKWKSKRYRR